MTRESADAATVPGSGSAAVRPAVDQRYVLLEHLGEGGMGTVHAAYDRVLDRKVAFKVLHDHLLGDVHQARLVDEARAMARLSHPNVVPVYDAGEQDGRAFLAMELVRGTSLEAWLATPRPWREVVERFRAAGRGVAAAHAAGIVHRDLKPSNILVGDDGRVQVSDFGIASRASAEALGGSPAYMAPEQARGQEVDGRADQFSLCVSIYEALHGQIPFAGDSLDARLRAIDAGPPPPVRALPAWLNAAVARGLAADPAARFPSMSALCDALEEPAPPARRSWSRLVAVGALALGAGAATTAVATVARDRGAAPTCDDAVAALDEVWDGDRRAALVAAFAAAGDTAGGERVIARLDDYASSWRRVAATTCGAELDGTWPAELGRRAAVCLDGRRAELAATIDALAGVDRAGVAQAIDVVAGLTATASCGDADYLQARIDPPRPAGQEDALDALDRRLRAARAAFDLGRIAEVEAQLAALKAEAERLDHDPSRSRALGLEAELASRRGENAAAAAAYADAYSRARAGRDPDWSAFAASRLIAIHGVVADDLDRAEDWTRIALAEVASQPGSKAAVGVHDAIAALAHRRGQAERMIEHARASLAIVERLDGRDHFRSAHGLDVLASALSEAGQHDEALRLHREAVATLERWWDPSSSKLVGPLVNLAATEQHAGELEAAEATIRRAVALADATGVKPHTRGLSYLNLAAILFERGQVEASLEPMTRARDLFTEAGVGGMAAQTAGNLAALRLQLAAEAEDGPALDAALVELEGAIAMMIAAWGADHPTVLANRLNLAEGYMIAGRCRDAVPIARGADTEQARAILAGCK